MNDELQTSALYFYPITALTAGIVNFVLTLFVVSRNLRASANRVYLLWGTAMTLWNLSVWLKSDFMFGQNPDVVWWLLKVLHLSLIMLPLSMFHLSVLVARLSYPRLLKGLYLIHGAFAVAVFTPLYFNSYHPSDYGPLIDPEPLVGVYLLLNGLLSSATIILLYHQQKTSPSLHRTRVRALLLALIALAVVCPHDYLLLTVDTSTYTYPFTNIKMAPLGNLAAIFFGIVVSYSVLQHQLLDIHVTLSRNAAQTIRLSFMLFTCFFLLLVFKILLIFTKWKPEKAYFIGCLVVLLATILIAARAFPRFFGAGDEKWERRILGDWFEYHDKVMGFTRMLPMYTNTGELMDDLHLLLVNTVKVRRYHIILLDESRRSFSLFRAHPEEPVGPVPGLSLESPVFQSIRQTKIKYLASKLAYAVPGESDLERLAREQLQRWDPELSFPFFHGEDPFGLLLIGEKVSNEPYTRHDIQLLVELVKNLSLVLNQIRLKNQLLQAEEMELLGNMSRGLAHDLNNLLTPVSTYLQLTQAGFSDPEMTEKLLPTALRNVDTIRSYVREALFFSKTQSLQLEETSLQRVIASVVELIQDKLKRKTVKISIEAPPDDTAEVDTVLMQRLIGNLLSNAIDASPAGAEIRIVLNRLAKVQSDRDWFRLRVIDQGEGISAENLKHVATPYFTTKDRGNGARGFGLGLAICRKIVHLHGGHLVIMSEERKGTTVQVDLPDRQTRKSPSTIAVSA